MKRLLTSCFGLGWLPLAPGTWGSLPPMLLFVLLAAAGLPPAVVMIVMAASVVAGSFICVRFAPAVIAATAKTDPRELVADEFAGQALTLLIITPFSSDHACIIAVLGFLLFRFFDIFKPWPIRRLEKFPAGWGILADDLFAGIYAGLMLFFCLKIGFVDYLAQLCCIGGSSIGVFTAAILGAVQGLTEFLPISSSGHLVLLENLFSLDPEKPGMLLFDLAVHVGTLVAIFIVFRTSIVSFFNNLFKWRKYGDSPLEIYKKNPGVHFLVLAVVTTIVTGTLGLLFKDFFASARGSLMIVAGMWIITATLLLITDLRKKSRLGLRQFGMGHAILIGLAQAAAIMPGISRSGATICVAILIGLHRRWAVEFSFLIAVPAILGAATIQLVKDFAEIRSGGLSLASATLGAAVAAVTGIIALKLLIRASRTAKLKVFAVYCYILAAFVIVYLLSKS